ERVADDAFLLSGQSGWDVVHMMARSPQDHYGRFFLSHLSHFYEVANPSEVHEKETQLRRNLVYALIRQGDREGFEREMDYFEKASAKNPSLAVDLAMFSAEWAGTHEPPRAFKKLTNALRRGVLKN